MTREHDLEIGSLLKDRWYIILKSVEDEDKEGFRVSAYDTPPMPDADDDYLEAGIVAQQGIMELLETDLDRVMEAGLARLSFNDLMEEIEEQERQREEERERERAKYKITRKRKTE